MRLSPLEIRKQEFKKAMRGYDVVEVDTFMEKLAEDYENLIQENSTLSKRVISVEAELKHFKEVEKTLKETLYNMQKTSQLSKQTSEKEATLVKREAELSATQMIDKARQEVLSMREEVNTLRQQKESFIARLRHLLTSQIELLEVLEIDEEGISEVKDRTKKTFSATPRRPERKKTAAPSAPPVIKTSQEPEQSAPPVVEKNKGHEFFGDIFDDDKL